MGITKHLKDIGRGHDGRRDLGRDAAEALMGQLLDGACSDLQLGAFCMAMRTKGETIDELLGFVAALQARVRPVASDRPVLLVASYHGARQLPNLTPLLALRLAQEGVRVLVHGPAHLPDRVGSAAIFASMGLPPADSAAGVDEAWSRHEPAFIHTAAVCPGLQALQDVRSALGLRNSGHLMAKLMNPVRGAPALHLCSHTRPDVGTLLAGCAERGAADMVLLQGTEGEPVADPRRLPGMTVWLRGHRRTDLSCAAQDSVLAELPLLPRSHDPATTAHYIQAVASGEKPAPAPLERQVRMLVRAMDALHARAPAAQLV